MDKFTTEEGDTLIRFTGESLMRLAQRGITLYCLFKETDKSIKVRKSSTKLIWEKEKEHFSSFFSRVYPMGVDGCIGLFYNTKDCGELLNE